MNRRADRLVPVLLVAAGLGLLRWFDLHPVALAQRTPDRERAAVAPPSRPDAGDVVLLVSSQAVARSAEAGDFERLDLSYAWISLLEAEFGAFALVDLDRDTVPDLEGRGAIVLSRSAQRAADASRLASLVRAGATLLVDALDGRSPPPPDLLALAGLSGPPGRRPFDAAFVPPDLPAEERAAFLRAPVRWPDDAASWRLSGARPLEPARLVLERRLGKGRVVSLCFDFAATHACWLQGRPSDGRFAVRERLGDYEGLLEPDDLVSDPRLRSNEYPFADVAAFAVCRLLDPPSGPALPRLAWFPPGATGVLLSTHDEDLQGPEASLSTARLAVRLGLRPTLFLLAHPRVASDWRRDDDPIAALEALGGEVDLHWDRFARPFGIGPVGPVAFVRPVSEQLARLRSLSPAAADARCNRTHFLVWGPSWAAPFRILEAAGIGMDLTFGSNKGRGLLFGTARPFRPLDDNGFPFRLLEQPFVNQEDWGGADEAFFRRLLEDNAGRRHGAVVTLFHPHLALRTRHGRALFRSMARSALDSGHVAWTVGRWLDWWNARAAARLRSRLLPDGSLEIAVAAAEPVRLLLPAVDGEPRQVWRLDGADASCETLSVHGEACLSVAVPAGRHRLLRPAPP